jgi:hypothetical protein
MPKTFYTDHDIEDLVKRGVQSLEVNDDVVLTDLANDKARRLGLRLVRSHDTPPGAPVRPYIAKLSSPSAGEAAKPTAPVAAPSASVPSEPTQFRSELHQRVYQAAKARLGDGVDSKLLSTVIERVLKSISTN